MNRTLSKAKEIARRIRNSRLETDCVFEPDRCDLLIQSTSLGLKKEDRLPLDGKLLKIISPRFFYEMIYRPAVTPAMKLAKEVTGCHVASGLEMLLFQGAKAFEIWTGKRAPLEVMRRALRKEVYGHS
jgi:shikimate dehydrogenase